MLICDSKYQGPKSYPTLRKIQLNGTYANLTIQCSVEVNVCECHTYHTTFTVWWVYISGIN